MQYAGSGGGTGIYGIGPDGAGGTFSNGSYSPPYPSPHGGGGGSNGQTADGQDGGLYGGGGAQGPKDDLGAIFGRGGFSGGDGAVRIIWGTGRAFPSTNVDQNYTP